jgi:hypothetical protein
MSDAIALMRDTVSTSETSVSFYQTTLRNIPEDSHIHTRRRENLTSHQRTKYQNELCNYLHRAESVLLEMFIITQLVKKLPVFYGTWKFITVFTKVHHWAFSWVRWIHFTSSHPIFKIQSNIIVAYVRLPSGHSVGTYHLYRRGRGGTLQQRHLCLFLWTSACHCDSGTSVTALPTTRGQTLSLLRPLFLLQFSRFYVWSVNVILFNIE